MTVRVVVWGLALVMAVGTPALLPSGWSDAHAKRSRAKIEKTRRNVTPKRELPRSPGRPQDTASEAPAALPPPSFVWPLTLTLTTDRPTYQAGDLMTIAVAADAACDLTLISIAADGFAVVLFPNEYEPNNLLSAGAAVTIPRAGAAYQLRAKQPGTETLLGICSPPGTRPQGIVADYERYRFTLLGYWADFTSSIAKREVDIVKAAAEAARKRSRKSAPLPPLLPSSDPDSQGRSVLLLPVAEAP
jgi:hypothetical protein